MQTKYYTKEEVAQHNKRGDVWIIVYGRVYDVTDFDDHPGGFNFLLDQAGKDATAPFEGHEQKTIKEIMPRYYIGDLKQEEPPLKEENTKPTGY